MILLLSVFMGIMIGLVMGIFGSGGSILTIPLFVYGLGLDPKSAITTSLVVVAFTALMGALSQFRLGNVNVRMALMFGGVGILGALLGARLSLEMTGAQQLILFGVVMLLAAARMFALSRRVLPPDLSVRPHAGFTVVAGFLVGILTGLVGVGGGFLIVPALTIAGLPIRLAMGTSLFIIVINCLSAILGHWGHMVVHWDVVLSFCLFSTLMSFVGVRLANRIPAKSMQQAFAIFLLLVALLVLLENLLTP